MVHFCGISPAENLCGVYFAELKLRKMFLLLSCQLNKCTILQSARPPCSRASSCLAGGNFTCDILALIAAFEGSVDVASIANRKRH